MAGYADFEGAPEIAAEDAPSYPRPRRGGARAITLAAFIVLLALVGWLLYTLADTLSGDSRLAGQPDRQPAQTGETGTPAGGSADEFITVLSPVSTGTLVTAGRGSAQIVNQANSDYIRLISLRTEDRRNLTAEPILLQLEPGVLSQIAGQRVTVEIMAKSGETGPANFAVGCRVGDQDLCGRKRFRIGLQPEATVFTMSVPANVAPGAEAYLAINTDVSADAELSGEGAAVDVLYARLRLTQN